MTTSKHKHKATYYNDIALKLAHKLLGIKHLHYGYFAGKKSADLKALPAAQEAYVKNLLSYIPSGVHRIFDVGCGTGGVAVHLVKKKFDLVCLAPDPYLIEKTSENTNHKVETITDLYENVDHLLPESFDLILMSESCQYVKIKEGWQQHRKFLKTGGYVLIADFFKIKDIDKSYVSKAGHSLQPFLDAAEEAGFKLIKRKDITKEVAPTMDIYQELIDNKVFPVLDAIYEFMTRRYPFILKIGKKLFGKKFADIKEKYAHQDSATFVEYKAYNILLFKKN